MSHIQLDFALLHFADAAFVALKKERMFFSKCKHFSWNDLLQAVHSSIPLRFISLMRHSPHKNKREDFLRNTSIPLQVFSLIFTLLIASAQRKSTTPGNLMSETVPASAPPGARTLHTLIKSQVLYQMS